MELGFPHARCVLRLRSRRSIGAQAADWEERFYLSSREPESTSPEQWISAIREHWGGIENRNHWRKDACLLEDRTRSRNPNIVGSLILFRNLVLHYHAQHQEAHPTLPAFVEANAADNKRTLALVKT
jgi:predicted transposase YbfD/YdcC